MERITTNHSAITWELFREGFEVTFNRKVPRTLRWCGVIFAVSGILALAVQMLLHKMLVVWFPLLFLGVFTVIWSFFLPNNTAKKKYKALCRWKKDVVPQRETDFYETTFVIYEGEEELRSVDYTDIKALKETEHLMVILCEDGAGILLEKAGFAGDGLETVRHLLEQAD